MHQDAVVTAVRRVLARLDAHAAGLDQAAEGVAAAGELTALDALCVCFGLSGFERDVLLLCAAMELDPSTAARCAAAAGDPERGYPTFSLALAALAEPHWSALPPIAPLRRWLLLEPEPGGLTTARLRISERVLHFLVGLPYVDTRLHGLVRRVRAEAELPDSQWRSAQALLAHWHEPDGLPQAELAGADERTRWEVAAAAADQGGLALHVLRAEDLPTDPAERELLGRLWEREALLLPAALLIEVTEATPAQRAAVERFTHGLGAPVVVSSTDPISGDPRGRARISVPAASEDEQRGLWAGALNGSGAAMSETDLRRLTAQFSLPGHVIRAAGESVRRGAGEGGDPAALAWQAGLAHARVALEELGRRVEPRAEWADLVLPQPQQTILREIIAHVRQRAVVHQDWGFEKVLRRGLGVTALFAGGSGTGKTLAAEVLAGRLGLDLFVVDLSQVVSKYIGETEKNLRRVFDAAERGGALLLFDEADALFGKRSEIKDSHDRYANIEVSYLLMRMESYRGLAILTTNMKKALDSAFLRRIRFVVDFPFPGPAERAEIWRRVIPASTPTDGLDMRKLAQLTVAGGSIRNVALSAAFLAAEAGQALSMRHLLAAARTEYLKLERALTPPEVAGWV
ncbi:ATP-binding protein [Crossiella cryophila]|uniref:Putative nucleic acid-binding protein n=1 Tax=Crossiella cryophila TaxID=43355 RepID=A0A7W7FYW1_9PSEU|nr:ATP-binding protein [Crossiella cryophila]MBB4682088.1 putative nucleic acid-binding protein [Crossiella cryophila]